MSDITEGSEDLIEVWRFRRYDVRAGQVVTSLGKATVSAIERFGAEAIPGSMEAVPLHRLDGNGIYTPPVALISAATRRRLERLRGQYDTLLAAEDHERLAGWADRVEALSTILRNLDEILALGTGSTTPGLLKPLGDA